MYVQQFDYTVSLSVYIPMWMYKCMHLKLSTSLMSEPFNTPPPEQKKTPYLQ